MFSLYSSFRFLKQAPLSLMVFLGVMILGSCRIDNMDSPWEAEPGSNIQITINITDDWVPENQIAEGVLALLIPQDWTINSALWSSSLSEGTLVYSETWREAAEAKNPATAFNSGMRWLAFTTDSAFSYTETQEFQAHLNLYVGDSLALYSLACMATRNTHSGSGSWTKIAYPHFIAVPRLVDYYSYRVEEAEDWTELFTRRSGWTGGDGTYSIPLDGSERYNPDLARKTLIHYSDTFIGEVNDAGVRQPGTYLVNNSQSLFTGYYPQENNIDFSWGENGASNATWIVPETPNSEPGQWFWQMDGISLEDSIHIFELRMRSDAQAGFAIEGVVLASGAVDDNANVTEIFQRDMALTYTNPDDGSQIVFGQAVMPLTSRSGCLDPDGYIYVYGPRSFSGGKALVAARVLEDSLQHIDAWRFWDGLDWSPDIENCADIISGISQEHSVIQTTGGEYLITFLRDGMSGPVCIAHAPTPVGPFSFPEVVWTPPETSISTNVFTYNAKAHPHLSAPGELLISYEVNTFSFAEHFSNADIYHPRFIRLVYDHYDITGIEPLAESVKPNNFKLHAFPNPFNNGLSLEFNSIDLVIESIVIYDITGKLVKSWNSNDIRGRQQLQWDGRNNWGQSVATGTYLVKTQVAESGDNSLTKITLLK